MEGTDHFLYTNEIHRVLSGSSHDGGLDGGLDERGFKKKRHGYANTKELFAFDDGLAERQSVFLVVAWSLIEGERIWMKVLNMMSLRTYWKML